MELWKLQPKDCLHDAAELERVDVLKMLLPELASDIVDAADEVENTALHFCQKTNCASKVTETLLSAKASVDIKNKAGESALNDSSEETS